MNSNIKLLILVFYIVFFTKTFSQISFTQNNTLTVIENGSELLNAWAGGLNFCQFSEIDLNLDGIKDILIFDRSGKNTIKNGNKIIPMIYEETINKYIFSPQYIDNFPLELENWVLLVDYNQDGKEDIFTSTGTYIALFTNTSSTELSFEFTKILTHDTGFVNQNVYVDGVDLPAIADIDNDCDIDILAFNYEGTLVNFYQNQSMELYGTCEAIDLYKTDDCWGNFKENFTDNDLTLFLNEDCEENEPDDNLRAHAGSTLLAMDLNPIENGGMELIIGDISYGNLVMVFNGGTTDNAYMISQDQSFPSYNESVELPLFPGAFYIDVDKDNLKDLIISPNGVNISENQKNCLFYKNIGTNQENIIQFDFIQHDLFIEDMISVGSGSKPIIHDLDNDGLLDLVIGNKGYYDEANYNSKLKAYKNIGSSEYPIFELISNDFANISQIGDIVSIESIHPTFGDLDQDLDQDLIIGDSNGKVYFIENIASDNTWPIYTNQIIDLNIDVGSHATPQLIDLNRDGLLDLIIGEKSGINFGENFQDCDDTFYEGINYFENIGTETIFDFNNQTPEFINLDGFGFGNGPNTNCYTMKSLGGVNLMHPDYLTAFTTPHVFEYNGEYHMAVGAEDGKISLFNNIENNIYGFYDLFSENILNNINCIRSTVAINDLNNDGLPDLIRGNASGGLELFIGTEFNLQTKEELRPVQQVSLYPNPNSGNFTIKHNLKNELNIQIFSITGKLINVFNMAEEEEDTTINLNNLKPGIYILKINENGKEIKNEKLIIK